MLFVHLGMNYHQISLDSQIVGFIQRKGMIVHLNSGILSSFSWAFPMGIRSRGSVQPCILLIHWSVNISTLFAPNVFDIEYQWKQACWQGDRITYPNQGLLEMASSNDYTVTIVVSKDYPNKDDLWTLELLLLASSQRFLLYFVHLRSMSCHIRTHWP